LLEACTNLPDWTPLRLFTCTNRPMVVPDVTADWYPQRFYRVAPLTAMPKPILGFAQPNPPASVRLALEALPGASYRIEVSTNLTQWSPLTNVNVMNSITVISVGSTNMTSRRFYRAVVE
jgi:hypothetical protein